MKFTLAWLRDHLETAAPLARISETLTAIGLEVESIHDPAAALKDFIVAEIREAAPHPNATKLQVCKVWDGEAERQIVCGAPNARAGLKTVLAREGVFIPGSGITIKKTKIRDVESNGMLCSAEELGLDAASEGILELPPTAAPGSPAAEALGANDPVIEIAITPNRADCLSVRGIARDLAAAGVGTLKPLSLPPPATIHQPPVTVALATAHCPYLLAVRISGVKNSSSPAWLQARLKAIGQKPISALVDITNYFTFAHGRPLHVFDAAKVSGGITVREAQAGEPLKALNGREYALAPGMTVIADDAKALAVGGIIGGEESGVTEATTDVILEIAYFNPVNIAQTGRALELQTDARYRFERGVDAHFMQDAAALATAMIIELCSGTAGQLTIAGSPPALPAPIPFNPARVASLGGVDVPQTECLRILKTLGFSIPDSRFPIPVTPPSWRPDITGEADLVEEILRIHGYANIPATQLPKPPAIGKAALSVGQQRIAAAKRALVARGMLECCTWSFLSREMAEAFGGGTEALTLQNPISAELSDMRPGLLPNLLEAAARNAARGARDLALFEVGLQFHDATPGGQRNAAAAIRTGALVEHAYLDARFSAGAREPDCFDAKADALTLLAALEVNTESLAVSPSAPAWYHPGRSGTLSLGKTVLAHFGEIHPALATRIGLEGRVAACEVFLDAIPLPRARGKAKAALKPLPYPAVERDFAFIVDTAIPAADILRALRGADKTLITGARLFDVYAGKGVEEGKKSVAVKITLQSPERTLTEADIAGVSQAVIQAAEKSFGGVLRA